MAACGALRLLPYARLRWVDKIPELDFGDDVVAALTTRLAERLTAPEIEYRPKLKAKMDDAAWQDLKELPGEWALAFGEQTETGMRCTNLKIRPGDYDMVRDARTLVQRLSQVEDVEDKLREALEGPWRYEDADCVAWGWDAAARIDAAAIDRKAENAPKAGVLGAYWLGWEALPLFPMISGKTLGWSKGLRYPTWSEWLDYHDVKGLMLRCDGLGAAERKALGVSVWFAQYQQTHQSSGRLGWACQRARTSSDGKTRGGSRTSQPTESVLIV
jgi:hypothetical protein